MATASTPPPPPPPPPSPRQTDEKKRSTTKKSNGICQVCGDVASINNYGALSCLSCRTFFRRNAFPDREGIPCRFYGQCEINMLTRHTCAACRREKCLTVGMSPDFIRKEDLTRKKRKSSEQRDENESKLTITSMVPSASLDHSERTLISNVIYAFDVFNPISEIQRRFDQISSSNFPTTQCETTQSLEILSPFYQSIYSFISSTPDFQVLSQNEQISLVRRNMLGLFSLGMIYLMRECGIFERREHQLLILPVYGNEMLEHFKSICQQINCDPVSIKLFFVAIAFSSNSYTMAERQSINGDSLLQGTFRLFGSQNVYVELLWKYLVETYIYSDAVQRYSNLIRWILDSLRLSIELYQQNLIHQTFLDENIERTQNSLLQSNSNRIPLWGKK